MNDLNPDARRLVDLARTARTPGAGDKMRVAERLAVPLAVGAAAASAAGVAKATTGAQVAASAAGASVLSGIGVKIAALVAVGAIGTAVVVAQLNPHPPATASNESAAPTQPVTAPVPPPAIVAPAPTLEDAPAQPEPQPLAPEIHQKSSAPPVHSSKPTHELAQEAALLHQAQSAWRAGQSAQALRLANQHAEQFPHSQLANERDVLRVLSLCSLGQVQAAKQIGARLLRQTKGSPWYQSVADSCAAN